MYPEKGKKTTTKTKSNEEKKIILETEIFKLKEIKIQNNDITLIIGQKNRNIFKLNIKITTKKI